MSLSVQTKQGWIQTFVIVVSLVGTIMWVFSDVKATATNALEKANEARSDIKTINWNVYETKLAVSRMETIIEERLPSKKKD